MRRIVPAAIILLWLNPCAWAQTITTDTVVVANAYQDKVIIATDSRVLDNISGKYRDDDCKIAELGGKFVFASALTRSINLKVNGAKMSWDSHISAQQALESTKGKSVEEVAREWGELGTKFFAKPMATDRKQFMAFMIAHNPAGMISVGLFGGPSRSESTAGFVVTISYNETTVSYSVRRIVAPITQALGVTNIVIEFAEGKTERAKQERLRWNSEIAGKSPDLISILEPIQWVQWTIDFGPETVHGPIDAILVDGKGIRWIQRPTCGM